MNCVSPYTVVLHRCMFFCYFLNFILRQNIWLTFENWQLSQAINLCPYNLYTTYCQHLPQPIPNSKPTLARPSQTWTNEIYKASGGSNNQSFHILQRLGSHMQLFQSAWITVNHDYPSPPTNIFLVSSIAQKNCS